MRSTSPQWLKCGSVSIVTVWGDVTDISWCFKCFVLNAGCKSCSQCEYFCLFQKPVCVCVWSVVFHCLTLFQTSSTVTYLDKGDLCFCRWTLWKCARKNVLKQKIWLPLQCHSLAECILIKRILIFNTSSICFQSASLRCCWARGFQR